MFSVLKNLFETPHEMVLYPNTLSLCLLWASVSDCGLDFWSWVRISRSLFHLRIEGIERINLTSIKRSFKTFKDPQNEQNIPPSFICLCDTNRLHNDILWLVLKHFVVFKLCWQLLVAFTLIQHNWYRLFDREHVLRKRS